VVVLAIIKVDILPGHHPSNHLKGLETIVQVLKPLKRKKKLLAITIHLILVNKGCLKIENRIGLWDLIILIILSHIKKLLIKVTSATSINTCNYR